MEGVALSMLGGGESAVLRELDHICREESGSVRQGQSWSDVTMLVLQANTYDQDLAYFGNDGKPVFMPTPDAPATKVSKPSDQLYPCRDMLTYADHRKLTSSDSIVHGSSMFHFPCHTRLSAKWKNTSWFMFYSRRISACARRLNYIL